MGSVRPSGREMHAAGGKAGGVAVARSHLVEARFVQLLGTTLCFLNRSAQVVR